MSKRACNGLRWGSLYATVASAVIGLTVLPGVVVEAGQAPVADGGFTAE